MSPAHGFYPVFELEHGHTLPPERCLGGVAIGHGYVKTCRSPASTLKWISNIAERNVRFWAAFVAVAQIVICALLS